ncbi:MAG: alcohol dehydrogenase catalytic domain-containing protein [Clostridia bacterium]|nr:alcohol dehydrogenase catalytic domain-containing protein [Clostridia bacterium]
MNIPKTMRALVAYGPGKYALEQVPVPEVGPEDILLKVEGCGICAGDVKASHPVARFWGGDGMPGFCEPPFIPGHEFIGTIAAMGGAVSDEFHIGDRVASEQIVPCGKCRYCREGKYWLCGPHNVYGFKSFLNGGMAEYVRLPRGSRNYVIPKDLPLEKALLVEPFACSLHGVRQGRVTADDVVVLAGAGTLGLGMIGPLRRCNPRKLIVLDMVDKRLEKAREFGADLVINPGKEDAVKKVLDLTEGYGCDVYLEVTGHPSAVQQGLDMICKGGRFVEFSVMSGPSTIDFSIIGDAKEITMRGSQLSPYCFEPVIRSIVDGSTPTDGVVSHMYPLEQWEEAFRMAEDRSAFKIALIP